MKNHNIPKSSERYGKLVLPIRHSLPVGLFSSQNSLFASIISVKNREENSKSQKQKNSQTHFEAATQRAVTPNSQNKCIPFTTKYHLSSQPQKQKKKSNLINKESIQSKISNLICQNKSADFNNISSQNRDGDDQEITKIFNNLRCVSQQINAIKVNQLSQQILSQWQKVMTSNCEKLVEINQQKKKSEMEYPQLIKSNSSSSQINYASGFNLEKLLAEERRNRLLVEEQTSKIISSQESEIKSYVNIYSIIRLRKSNNQNRDQSKRILGKHDYKKICVVLFIPQFYFISHTYRRQKNQTINFVKLFYFFNMFINFDNRDQQSLQISIRLKIKTNDSIQLGRTPKLKTRKMILLSQIQKSFISIKQRETNLQRYKYMKAFLKMTNYMGINHYYSLLQRIYHILENIIVSTNLTQFQRVNWLKNNKFNKPVYSFQQQQEKQIQVYQGLYLRIQRIQNSFQLECFQNILNENLSHYLCNKIIIAHKRQILFEKISLKKMNQLEQKAVRSLLKLAREEDTITQRDWEPQSPKQLDLISPQPKTLNQNRRNVRMIPYHQARQKSSIEMNQDNKQHSELSQKENSLQQIIEEYMKQIRQTQRQMESIHQQKFDLKSGWMNFSSIILENKQQLPQKHKRSSLELQVKENNQQKVQQQQSFKKTSLRKVLNNESFFLPKLRSTYLK